MANPKAPLVKQLLFSTQNKGKQSEVRSLLDGLPIKLIFPQDVKEVSKLDPEETGTTFSENAWQKAKAFASKAKKALGHDLLVVADDSGLEVDGLEGKPGVNSKRFIPGSDEDRNKEILKLIKGLNNRRAQFVTVLCLYDTETKKKEFFEGVVEGMIAEEPKGGEGFGYDPIFIPNGYYKTFAQLGVAEKNKLSHRARALQLLKKWLKKELV